MSKEYGYIGKEVEQAFRSNKGIFTPQDIIELDQENKWTNFGQLELIQTIVSSGSTTSIEFTDLKENVYNTHLFTFTNIQSALGVGGQLHFNVFTSQYSGYDTNSHYSSALQRMNASSGFSEFRQASVAFPYIQGTSMSGNANLSLNGYWYFYNFGDSTKRVTASGHTTSETSSSLYVSEFGTISYIKERPVTQIKFKIGGGTTAFIDGSTISCYGIREF